MKRFRGGLVFKAHRVCVSLNSRLGNHKEEEEGSNAPNLRLMLKVHGVLALPSSSRVSHEIHLDEGWVQTSTKSVYTYLGPHAKAAGLDI